MPEDTNSIPQVVLGDYAWDVLIRTNSALSPGGDSFGEVMLAAGGSAANVAVWARRCGLEVAFIGKIGCDPLAQLAKEDMRQEQVRTHFVGTTEHLTASVAVWIDHTGERSMVSGQGADFYLLPSELPKELLTSCHHLHLSGWSFFTDPPRSAACQAATWAKEAGATLSFDPASFQLIEETGLERFLSITTTLDIDMLFPNFDEGKTLTGLGEPEAIVKALAELYPTAIIILKLDAEGALIYDQTKTYPIRAAEGQLLDATGAGDAFAGSFLAAYLKQSSLQQAGNFASHISAWVIERLGARPAIDPKLGHYLEQNH
jgi:ribokinase